MQKDLAEADAGVGLMSSGVTGLYTDALLAHYSYPPSTSSFGKTSVAGQGSAEEDVPDQEHHPEVPPQDRRGPDAQRLPREGYRNAGSDTGEASRGSPVAVHVPEFREPAPPSISEMSTKQFSPPPLPFEFARWGYLPAIAVAIILTACLLLGLAYAIRSEDNIVAPEVAPLVNISALDSEDDCPCRRGSSTRRVHGVARGHSTSNAVTLTTRKSKRHRHHVGSKRKSSTGHPPHPKAAPHSTPSDSVGRLVPANPALYGVGEPSPASRVPEGTTRPHKETTADDTSGAGKGQAIPGSGRQTRVDDVSVAEVTPSMTHSPEEIEAGGENSVQEV